MVISFFRSQYVHFQFLVANTCLAHLKIFHGLLFKLSKIIWLPETLWFATILKGQKYFYKIKTIFGRKPISNNVGFTFIEMNSEKNSLYLLNNTHIYINIYIYIYGSGNILWLVPPFNTEFWEPNFQIIKQILPTSNDLHKMFNQKPVRLSYCWMSNVTSIQLWKIKYKNEHFPCNSHK